MMGWKLRCALTTLFALLAAPAVRAASDPLLQRMEQLEREMRELKRELERRQGAEPAERPVEPEAPARVEPAAPPEPLAEKPGYRAVLDRVKLGAYGSFRYETSSLEDQKHTFTFRRFVLTADADIAPRLRAYMELEFERFRKLELEKSLGRADGGLRAEQTVEGTNESEIAFEQAWLEYEFSKSLKLRGGAHLVPLGRFNLNHDDNRWDLPRRSLVDRGVPVLPVSAAWDEIGVGFVGDIEVGRQGVLSYQVFGVNGVSLDAEFEQIAQTRGPQPGKQVIEAKIEPATGTFGSDVKDAKAVTGRLAYSPWLGHELAGSWYYGQYTPDFLGKEDLWSVGLDGRTGYGPFELEGQYVFTRFEGVGSVARRLAAVAVNKETEFENPDVETEIEFELTGLARNRHGYWLDLRYRFWPTFLTDTFLGRHFDNPQLVAVVRGEQAWLDDLLEEAEFSGARLTALETDDRRVDRITGGLAYRPIPLVVFHLAYEFTQTNSGKSLAGVTNFLPARDDEDTAHTVMVGAAFGF